MKRLSELAEKYSIIQDVRGKGLMIGIQLSTDAAVEIRNKCFDKGYLVGSVGKNIIRMLPPLIVTEQDIDGMIDTLDSVFQAY
ncbi:acetylornithine aminotransferase [Acetivibrio straminisolvens JCM 21531]|uniref:Acetylornithine aminotransferase n=2 Tax=Acetivibrio straminisolvens TaxID=253314 RepID=W4V649_9FIRM|nr:acetylornithine aminotransferase [Acetivibrio straminisolvens JCM 21531]